MKSWFYRFTAAHFCLTAITGLLLYFRPLDDREGWYSNEVKEVLVGLHNGELWSYLLFNNRYPSGLLIGIILGVSLITFSVRKTSINRRNNKV
ncbi:hypothetical protein MYX65_08065 [Acidobacteria bacterium AH-259-L09]|nr:hypothetical protein [Acidobacteria bacterium AH-259-L09]